MDVEIGIDFNRDILPGLAEKPLSKIMSATGLSLRYCSLIRRGLKVPHAKHWGTLERLVGGGFPATVSELQINGFREFDNADHVSDGMTCQQQQS